MIASPVCPLSLVTKQEKAMIGDDDALMPLTKSPLLTPRRHSARGQGRLKRH